MAPNFANTPSFTARQKSAAGTAGRAFVVEALLLLAFLAVSVAIILQVFVAAGTMSRDAHTLSMSQHLAANAAEVFASNPTNAAGTAYYTTSGDALPGPSTAAFAVETSVDERPEGAGTTYFADISVFHLDGQETDQAAYQLQTQRYLSATSGPSASEGGAQ